MSDDCKVQKLKQDLAFIDVAEDKTVKLKAGTVFVVVGEYKQYVVLDGVRILANERIYWLPLEQFDGISEAV